MGKIALSFVIILIIMFVVPMVVYGIFSMVMNLKPPEGASPAIFLLSVFIEKFGHALAFVLIFYFARNSFSNHWMLYALIWFTMFAVGEVGQAVGPKYSWPEAIAGIISEAVYFPLSAFMVKWLIGIGSQS